MDKYDHKAHTIVFETIPNIAPTTGVCRENLVKANDGGFVFPLPKELYEHSEINPFGMSLRDWFAGMAMQGMQAIPDLRVWRSDSGQDLEEWRTGIFDTDAQHAYRIADAMLKARSIGKKAL